MITAIQNFISRKGKLVFLPLLAVIIVAFVLYLAQGASVFDFLPDPNRERRDFYGVNLNDPDENRKLSVYNRAASDFGALVAPLPEAMQKADARFMENLQAQVQAAFRANREDIDQAALQRMFGFMQSWPNLPNSYKIREIARAGVYDNEFSQSSIEAKIIMDYFANEWGFLPLNLNDPQLNTHFSTFVEALDPTLSNEENRTRAFAFVGQRNGVPVRHLESILYSHFRAHQVDRSFSQLGLALNKEGELDLHSSGFAWDADLFSVKQDDLGLEDPAMFKISLNTKPQENDRLSINNGSKSRDFVFVKEAKDSNGTEVFVKLGDNVGACLGSLSEALEQAGLGFSIDRKKDHLLMTPLREGLAAKYPEVSSSSDGVIVEDMLENELEVFHDERKEDDLFAEPARTFASAVIFSPKKFLSLPPEPDEARMRSYFERNRFEFESPLPPPLDADGAKGPVGTKDSNGSVEAGTLALVDLNASDLNQTVAQQISFEDVKEQVRQRILDGDRIDAEREAEDLAKEKALDLLDSLNELGDRLRTKYGSYGQRRNSPEFKKLLAGEDSTVRPITFSQSEMVVQGRVLGLERRESEKRMNREPLAEVAGLNERIFFTRSIRKSRDGFVVFVLDRKTEQSPGSFDRASFSLLYREFADKRKSDAFSDRTELVLQSMREGNESAYGSGHLISVDAKDGAGLRASYDSQSRSITGRLTQLESEREEITNADRDSNATASQIERKKEIDLAIEELRDEQSELNQERVLAVRLVEACSGLEANAQWTELERTGEEAIFVRLRGVYSMRSKNTEFSETTDRVSDLELARAERSRDQILKSLHDLAK